VPRPKQLLVLISKAISHFLNMRTCKTHPSTFEAPVLKKKERMAELAHFSFSADKAIFHRKATAGD